MEVLLSLLMLITFIAKLQATAVHRIAVVMDADDPKAARTAEALEDAVLRPLAGEAALRVQLLEARRRALRNMTVELNKSEGVVAVGRCWLMGKAGELRVPVLGVATEETCLARDEGFGHLTLLFLKEEFSRCAYELARRWVLRVASGRPLASADGVLGVRRNSLTQAVVRRVGMGGHTSSCPSPVRSAVKRSAELVRIPEMTNAQKVKAEARAILSGHVLSVVLKHRPPYVSLVKDGRRVAAASGILIEVLDSMAEIYNFTYTLKLPDDDQWGSLKKDGSWTGMVGEVYRGEQEMALGPTSITEEREKAIDFTVPFDYEPWDILIPQSIQKIDFTAYLFPFSGVVWAATLASLVVVGMVMFLMVDFIRRQNISDELPRQYSLPHFVFNCLGSLLCQANKQPQPGASRVMSGFWWIFSVIFIASYSSKLISSLTVRFTVPPVTSLRDMVESKKLLWTYLANSAMEEIFRNSAPDTTFGMVGQLHKDRPGLLVGSFEEGVEAVRTQKFAYLEDNSWLEFAVADEEALYGECRMTVVRDNFFATRFGIILQPGSPYRDAFTIHILEVIQSGLMAVWKKKYWPVSRCIGSSKKAPLRSLNILDLAGTFVLLVAGAMVSALTLILEILVARAKGGAASD
ncbi:glutamate receptor ionotropic, kainate glr-3-like isoform X2 [Penaeus chinensis]|uniref:glutamate receptor ionotropic, kainate glr-3-like isoform X2 n=1 Tax=Penaeus chinensis TaxID=139456 RepID=UPI001FB6674E|nr:glutamate receptor ionotropic, kainate glr-3-like isoform X2 [Penaeus chinensis]XP_047485457.1 glutamate receptor ionotropic, kainate glr-3-like isoform X2 [Penaeus chinensis]XP_047485458.1 glutamate receptor ionotropic, kainate glr-3-like isoform X2 [Penaeus chinensis]XP_047485459.1 glutamate receptor ionotropic, kainate glr-3-like isoform X2 [Penaeus chinensis]